MSRKHPLNRQNDFAPRPDQGEAPAGGLAHNHHTTQEVEVVEHRNVGRVDVEGAACRQSGHDVRVALQPVGDQSPSDGTSTTSILPASSAWTLAHFLAAGRVARPHRQRLPCSVADLWRPPGAPFIGEKDR